MLRKIINTTLFLPLSFFVTFQQSILSENKNFIDEIIRINEDKIFIDHQEIKNIILNNDELKSFKELIEASSFNLSSKIAKRYPSIDLQANGLPKYVAGRNYNSNSNNTKTSQFSVNPSLNIRWDLIYQMRGPEIKIARENLKSDNLKNEIGGLSGKPLSKRSTEMVRLIKKQAGDKLPIIAVGGIMSPEDVVEKINAGASLVQIYTGWIYYGPTLVYDINRKLLKECLNN